MLRPDGPRPPRSFGLPPSSQQNAAQKPEGAAPVLPEAPGAPAPQRASEPPWRARPSIWDREPAPGSKPTRPRVPAGVRAGLVGWISAARAAKTLGIPRRTMGDWCRDGRVPARKQGRIWRLPLEFVRQLREGEVSVPSSPRATPGADR
jgi:excisionase family DNA binding protein